MPSFRVAKGVVWVLGFATLLVATTSSCSSMSKRFASVLPGMTSAEVKRNMGEGPSRLVNVPNTYYTSWYWGTDYCVLFQDDKVVSKGKNLCRAPGLA